MLTLGELALFMDMSAGRARVELIAETGHLIEGAVADAKATIGIYQPGWAELADATKADRLRRGYTENDPLLRTGEHIRDAIEGSVEMTFEGVDAEFGSSDKIALFNEVGTSRVPPRPFIAPASVRAEPKIEEALGELAQTLLFPGIR